MASVLTMLGVLAMLRAGLGDWDVRHARVLFLWPAHFLTGVAQAAIGIAGVWCAQHEHTARAFLMLSGVFLTGWAVAGLILDANPNDVFTADPWLVGIHLVAGVVSIAMAVRSAL